MLRSLLIVAAAGLLLTDAAPAQMRLRPRNAGSYTAPGYNYRYRYVETQRPGLFGSIMEFERRKNEFLFGR